MKEQITTMENWAQQIVQRELCLPVDINDTGKEPGMYDLRIGNPNAPEVAIECIRAVDPIRTETWNVGPGRGAISLNLSSDWIVEVTPSATINLLRARIEALLLSCETHGYTELFVGDWNKRSDYPDLFSQMESLGIESIECIALKGRGKVYFTMTGVGGVVNTEPNQFVKWIGDFLRAPERADVVSKLQKSGAHKCHVFVHVEMGGVPWEVESYLGDGIGSVVIPPPDLPSPVSDVWISYRGKGLRWDGSTWRTFAIRQDVV
jgi:hypothetical protein